MNEDVLLEEVLALAEQDGYEPAYDFLLAQRGAWKDGEHPQIYYFLACLAAGAGRAPAALEWLAEAVEQKEYWYRPEVLDDGDLKPLFGDARFETLRKISEGRYEEARRAGRMQLSWRGRAAGTLVLAVHGNGQNAGIGRRWSVRVRRWKQCSPRWWIARGGFAGNTTAKITGRQRTRRVLCRTRAMSGRFGRAFPPAVICCCARCCIPGFPATRWRCNPRGHRCLRRTAQRFAVRWRKKT